MRAAFRAAVDVLADDGAQVVEAAPDAPYPTELWNDVALPEGFASEGPLLAEWGDADVRRAPREIVEAGRAATAADYLDAQERRRDYTPAVGRVLRRPTTCCSPRRCRCRRSGPTWPSPAAIDGVPVDPFFDDWCALALPANLTGCPATAVPTGLDHDGLPVGMQVMGPRAGDATTLAVAAALRAARAVGWALAPVVTGGQPSSSTTVSATQAGLSWPSISTTYVRVSCLPGGDVGDLADGDRGADLRADEHRVGEADLVDAVVELGAGGLEANTCGPSQGTSDRVR